VCNEKSLYPLPEHIDFKIGCLIGDTLGTAYHALNKSRIKPGEIVAIWGLGPIGVAVAQMVKLCGASSIIAIDVVPDRIELAKKLEIGYCISSNEAEDLINKLTAKEGVDVSIEVTGNDKVLETAFKTTRKGGTIVVVGIHSKNFSLPTLALGYREISLIGTFAHQFSEFELFTNLIASHKIKLESLISHTFPLDRINEAYKLFIEKKTNKVVLTPNIS